MRANFFLKSKIDAVSCISGLKRLKSRAAWYVSFFLSPGGHATFGQHQELLWEGPIF